MVEYYRQLMLETSLLNFIDQRFRYDSDGMVSIDGDRDSIDDILQLPAEHVDDAKSLDWIVDKLTSINVGTSETKSPIMMTRDEFLTATECQLLLKQLHVTIVVVVHISINSTVIYLSSSISIKIIRHRKHSKRYRSNVSYR